MPRPLRQRRTRIATAVALAASVALLAGCAPASDGASAATDDASITLALSNTPASFDTSNISQSPDSLIWTGLYDRLLRIDENGKYVPNAAESWSYSGDLKTLTLTLRDDLAFADGTAIDAETVVANLEYVKATPGQAQGGTASISSVEAPDAKTVVITLTQADPLLIDSLATYLGTISDPTALGDPGNATNPLSSGPYTLDETATVSGSVYVLQRRDDYWDVDNYPYSTLTIKALPDQQALFNAMQSGQIDATYVPSGQVDPFKTDDYTITPVAGIGVGGILIADLEGELVPALADERVRQAINFAFDREAIVEKIYKGAGEPAFQQVYDGVVGHDAALDEIYSYDPEKAKDLMAEAGYADGFTVTMPSTFLSQLIDPTIVDQLGAIGITVELEQIQPQDLGSVWASKKFAMGYWADGASNAARTFLPRLQAIGNFNPWNNTIPEAEALLADAALASTEEDIAAGWTAVNSYSVEHALSAPIAFNTATLVTNSDIAYLGTVPPQINTIRLYTPAD